MIFRISKQQLDTCNKQYCNKWKFGWKSCFYQGRNFGAKQMFVLSSSMKLGPDHNNNPYQVLKPKLLQLANSKSTSFHFHATLREGSFSKGIFQFSFKKCGWKPKPQVMTFKRVGRSKPKTHVWRLCTFGVVGVKTKLFSSSQLQKQVSSVKVITKCQCKTTQVHVTS